MAKTKRPYTLQADLHAGPVNAERGNRTGRCFFKMKAPVLAILSLLIIASTEVAAKAQDTHNNASAHGDWQVFDRMDAIDDSVETVAATEADDATLALVCRANGNLELLLALRFEYTGTDDQKEVIYRVDRNDPISERVRVHFTGGMTRLDWRLGIASGSSAQALIEQSKSGTRIAARTYNSASMAITKLFSLAGFTAATSRVLERCDYAGQSTLSADLAESRDRVMSTLGESFEATAIIENEDLTLANYPLFAAPGGLEGDLLRKTVPHSTQVAVLRRSQSNVTWYLIQLDDGYRAWAAAPYVKVQPR